MQTSTLIASRSDSAASRLRAQRARIDFTQRMNLRLRHVGRDYRLTDVYGNVVKEIMA